MVYGQSTRYIYNVGFEFGTLLWMGNLSHSEATWLSLVSYSIPHPMTNMFWKLKDRYIRYKERTRAIYCTLPFKKMPQQLVIEMVYAANYWLNMFPRTGGISKTLSPRTLLTGQACSYTTHCKLEFGDYVDFFPNIQNSVFGTEFCITLTCT